MRRIATIAGLAVLVSGAAITDAAAGDGCCRKPRRAYVHAPAGYVVPVRPWDAWRAYYDAQAEVSGARRAIRGSYYAATGRALPSRYFGPPTNYYAEYYSLDPYTYFTCPLARRGEGICPNQAPLSGVSD